MKNFNSPVLRCSLCTEGYCELQVGLVLPDVAARLPHHPDVFTVTGTGAGFHPSLDTPALRTAALERVLLQWRQQQLFPALAGWRGEQVATCSHRIRHRFAAGTSPGIWSSQCIVHCLH